MKKCKKLMMFSIAVFLVALIGNFAPAQAAGSGEEDLGDCLIENGKLLLYWGRDADVVIPEGTTEICKQAFYQITSVESITLPDSVTVIDDYAFENCFADRINIPSGVKSIGIGAFQNSGLTSVTLPEGIASISDMTFYGCSKLKSVSIPSSVKSIGKEAFSYCGLTSVTIPNGVESIGDGAFAGDFDLKSITMPQSVTSIGGAASNGIAALANYKGVFYCCDDIKIYGSMNSYAYRYAVGNNIPFVDTDDNSAVRPLAEPLHASVAVNNQTVSFDAYLINGSTYIKLRDIAMAVNNTKHNFNVTWDNINQEIKIERSTPYSPVGGEMEKSGASGGIEAVEVSAPVCVDGNQVDLEAYFIGGYSYFKLREVASAVNFVALWDSNINTICIYSDDTSLYDTIVGTWVGQYGGYTYHMAFSYGGLFTFGSINGTYGVEANQLYMSFDGGYILCTYRIENSNGQPVLYLSDWSGSLVLYKQAEVLP